MFRFQISAHTKPGEFIGMVGSIPELGSWDSQKYVPLHTSSDRYPLWSVDLNLTVPVAADGSSSQIEYKYVRIKPDEALKQEVSKQEILEWEAWGWNRWVPIPSQPQPARIIVEDGWLGTPQPWPYGYYEHSVSIPPLPQKPGGLKIVVVGSSVAMGCSAWLLQGWAWHLEQALNELYGHQVVNVSELGANVGRTIERFPQVVASQNPDIVILALSLGNEGLAYCPSHARRAAQRRFESGLLQLVKMTREIGARPMLASVYPHGDYSPEHSWLLQDTHHRMLTWGVPILNWLNVLNDGQGRWQTGLSFDVAHPNTKGHQLMFEAIDLSLFKIEPAEMEREKQRPPKKIEIPVYRDDWGFHIFTDPEEKSLRVINTSRNPYTIAAYWEELQMALKNKASLTPGVYIAKAAPPGTLPYFWVREDKTIETMVDIPPSADVEYSPAFNFFAPKVSQTLFYDGQIALLKENDYFLRVINESDHPYNIHPMWKEVRAALKAMNPGVYEDSLQPDAPFRTMMIGNHGLESRVKLPAKSSLLFRYKCRLSDIKRVAILPLGARCAARMALYKMEYDGPAFPFDLTRTTKLGDVADMIANGFEDMWNPSWLHYNAMEKRVYHSKWTGLSFAHEVEDTDDPVRDMGPVHERMRVRYSARAARFWYTIDQADEILFIRNGFCDRGGVVDLVEKLATKCQGKPFRLLVISPQPTEEYAGLANVIHYDLDFNPDQMYADEGYWQHCAEVLREILHSLGISSKNLFWCPPTPPKDNHAQS